MMLRHPFATMHRPPANHRLQAKPIMQLAGQDNPQVGTYRFLL